MLPNSMCQQATLEVLSLPWTVCFSQHITDYLKMCLSWSVQMYVSARTEAIPSCAAVLMLPLYFQLHGDKHRQTEIAGCIHTALERGQILSAHQGGCRWFPCVTPLSDQWEMCPSVSSKKSVYSYFCLQRLWKHPTCCPLKVLLFCFFKPAICTIYFLWSNLGKLTFRELIWVFVEMRH